MEKKKTKTSNCIHVSTIGDNTWEDVVKHKQGQKRCEQCGKEGPNLWLCLHHRCLFVGCGEAGKDCSTRHSQESSHHLTLNLTSMRIWCYTCEFEVYKDTNLPPFNMRGSHFTAAQQRLMHDQLTSHEELCPNEWREAGATGRGVPSTGATHVANEAEDLTEDEEDEEMDRPRGEERVFILKPLMCSGLAGLQNIGNTCYMNSALQALSNCPPLMRFFRDCPGFVPHIAMGRKPVLSKSYQKLVTEIWHKRRPSHLVPSSIAGGIKILYPMFRGYTQQDTQEFLRCFMDQLHEELKQPIIAGNTDEGETDGEVEIVNTNENCCNIEAERMSSPLLQTKVKESDTEYETCESGQSSERSSVESNRQEAEETHTGEGHAKPQIRVDHTKTHTDEGYTKMHAGEGHAKCQYGEDLSRQDIDEGHVKYKVGEHQQNEDTETQTKVALKKGGFKAPKVDVDRKGDMQSQDLLKKENSKTQTSEKSMKVNNKPDEVVANGSSFQGQQQSDEEKDKVTKLSYVGTISESDSYRPPQTRSSQKKRGEVNRSVSKDSGIENSHSEGSLSAQTSGEIQDSERQGNRESAGGEKSNQVRSSVSSTTETTKPVVKQGSRIRQASDIDRTPSKTQNQPCKSGHVTTKWKKKPPIEYQSVISDVFDGKLLSSVQCLTCERISTTKETFQDLSLPIPTKDHIEAIHGQVVCLPPGSAPHHKGACGEVSIKQGWFSWMFSWMKSWFWGPSVKLQDCLAAFFSADELKGDNMYSCEKCKKLRNGSKYSKVLKLPEVLCIHLKRFRHEFMFSTKVSTPVSFPMDGLDMRPYIDKDCKDEETQYDLVSVICHHGTAGGGHYTSYALNYINETWYEFDDQFVSPVDLQTVENCEAYVLFYRKKNDHMLSKRTKASEIALRQENSFMKFYISRQWINKFNTFAEPGPISNHDFICRHGGVHPYKYNTVDLLAMEVPQPMWEYLYNLYGGGPAVTHLYSCNTCKEEIDRLKNRQKMEKETFIKMNEEFAQEETSGAIYAISMSWFKEWENFVRDRTEEPPGPIENSRICVMKGGVPLLRHHSDYGQVSEEMWHFLYEIYGGGPEIITRPPVKIVQQQQYKNAASSEQEESDSD